MSLFKKKILEYIDLKGIKKSDFYRNTGIARSVLDKESGLTEDNVAKFFAFYTEVSAEWFITGEGNMTKEIAPKVPPSQIQEYEEKIRLLENTIKDKEKIISLQEKQLNYTKKSSLEMPPLPLVAESNIKYPQSPLTQENTPKHKKEPKRKQ